MKEYVKEHPLHSRQCELCGRPRNPQLLSICCFECERTMGADHDPQCDLRALRERESRVVPKSQGGQAEERRRCNVCGARPVHIAIPHV